MGKGLAVCCLNVDKVQLVCMLTHAALQVRSVISGVDVMRNPKYNKGMSRTYALAAARERKGFAIAMSTLSKLRLLLCP